MSLLKFPLATICLIAYWSCPAQAPFRLGFDDQDQLTIDAARVIHAENDDLVLIARYHGLPLTFRNGFSFGRFSADGVPLAYNRIAQLDSVQDSWLYDAIELADGSFAIAGRYESQAFLMRLSATGTVMGAWSYPGNGSPISTATCLEADGDSALVIGGWAHGNGPAYYDPRVLRVGWNGALSQAEGHSFGAYSAYILSSTKAQDGGIFFCGGVTDTVEFGSSDKNIFLFRTDPTGSELWSRQIYCGDVATAVQRIEQLPSGDLIVGGTHHQAPGGVAYPFLMKFTADGIPLWAKYFNLPSGTSFGDAAITSDDRIALTAIDPNFNMILMVLDTSGTILSAHEVETGEFAPSVMATPDGGLVIGSFDFPYAVGMDLGLARLDMTLDWMCPATGLSLTVDTFPFSISGPDSIAPLTVVPIDRTAFFADSASMVTSYVPCMNVSFIAESSEQPFTAPDLLLVNGWLTVASGSADRIEVLDASGRLLAASSSSGSTFQLDMCGSPAGLYLVRSFRGAYCKTGRVVKY